MTIRSFVIAAVLVFASVQVVLAQTSTSSRAKGASVDELETLSQQWMEAAQRHDVPTLERLMAKEFTLVHPSQDTVTTRAQWLAALARIETKRFQYQHLKVVHYGRSLAVVSAVFRIDAVMDGQPWAAPKTSVIDVWEKRGGHWQVVTRYATRPEELKIAPPASPK
jgi:ketosteroid isomerase-like protein